MGKIIALIILAIPIALTAWNIFALIQYLVRKIDKNSYKIIEVIVMFTGILYVFFYSDISNIVFVNWDIKLYNYKLSSMFYPDTFFTMGTILLIAFIGYILIRFIPAVKQSPMVSAVGISAVYLGIGICALWFTKTIRDFFLIFLTVNCIIIFVKTIYILVYQKNTFFQNGTTTIKYGKLSSILNKAANLPWIALILATPLLGIIIAVQPLMGQIIALIILAIPFALTAWNIFALIKYLVKKKEKNSYKVIEVIAMFTGILYVFLYADVSDIAFVNWDVQLYNSELHSMISPDTFLTIGTILLIAFIGYIIIRFIPVVKQSPIVSAIGISAVYLGIGICVLWCIQTISDFFLVLLPANCIIIFIKTIYILVYQKNTLFQNGTATTKYEKLSNILNKAANLPWIALILVIPLLGIIIAVLLLFGQEPNSIIKAWTETADWTMSQKIAPQNIQYDEHYLCTVAAGGHRKVVKPIRTGMRHGHRVIVNRQLCIANAFEQVLEEKTPVFHKIVRGIYNRTGYPISKHIHSKYLADTIYFLMKPLEWIFLLVLYTVDLNPENRIAVQYPHAPIPLKVDEIGICSNALNI